MKQRDGFRFSRDKRFRKVSFEEFLSTAKRLHETIAATCSTASVEVFTAEDFSTYNYTTVTFWSEEIRTILEQKKKYALDELTREVWDRSLDVQITWRDEKNQKSFMICMSCDKYADIRRIRFYGQGLDEKTYDTVNRNFRRTSWSYGISDGRGKISDFNMLMGQRLTGIRLPA